MADGFVEVFAVCGQCSLRDSPQTVYRHGTGHIVQHFLAESVVKVDDAQVLDAHGHQLLYQALGLVGVTGAHVKYVSYTGLAQRRGTRQGGDVGQARLFNEWQDSRVVGCTDTRHQGERTAVGDHFFHVVHGTLRHVGVVWELKLQLTAMHAAFGVDLRHSGVHAQLECYPEITEWASQSAGAADGDGLGGYPLLRIGGAHPCGCKREGRKCGECA